MIKEINRKSMKIRESGRSSDFISPSFGFGCLLNCSYCYMKRHKPKGLDYAKNLNIILTEINNHVTFLPKKEPNQTHEKYWTYDISCNEDFALHSKYYNWKYIFKFFKDHPKAMATLATKIIPDNFLEFNPEEKVRIRFSLMPQTYSTVLEPNTPLIIDRIKAVDRFIESGYDVHLNFSPVIYKENWLKLYKELFDLCDIYIKNKNKVKSEVIFLTHNEDKHFYNLENNIKGEELLWNVKIQEGKLSSYGGRNIRYRYDLKQQMINEFKNLHNSYIPWNTIRYIF
jgi:spore photoproduct lyase